MMRGSLPATLRLLRAREGWPLIIAAENLRIGRDTLADLEKGRRTPNVKTLKKIAEGYGVPVDALLEEESPLASASLEEAKRDAGREYQQAVNEWVEDPGDPLKTARANRADARWRELHKDDPKPYVKITETIDDPAITVTYLRELTLEEKAEVARVLERDYPDAEIVEVEGEHEPEETNKAREVIIYRSTKAS